LSAGQRNRKEDFYQPQVTTVLADHHIVESSVGMFPLYLAANTEPASLFGMDTDKPTGPRPNLSAMASEYRRSPGRDGGGPVLPRAGRVARASVREENAGALRQDWPRAPLPQDREALLASAELGRQVAGLLDTEREVAGVAARAGAVRLELRAIGPVTRVGGGSLSADDLSVTAGWGHGGNGRAVMPARGRAVERAYTAEEREAMTAGVPALGLTPEEMSQLLGEGTYDIYLEEE